jgi:uncharacterized protein (DUF58 family)
MVTVRRPFWAFLVLLVFGILGIFFTHATIYYRLTYLCVFTISIGFLWSYYSVRGFQINRQARILRHQVGQTFIEQFEIINLLPAIRLWIEIIDGCPMPGKTGSRVLSWIGSRQRRVYESFSTLRVRGFFPLGPTKIISGDPLGLFQAIREIPVKQSLIVLPRIEEIKNFPLPAGALSGGRVTGRRTFEISPQAVGVREYSSGDPLNRIHWLTTMRRGGNLMVKEFEQDPSADVWIFLDAHRSMHSKISENTSIFTGEESLWQFEREAKSRLPADSFEYAVSAAGSVANYFIRRGRAVGFVSAGQLATIITAERGERQQSRLLETLAFIKGDGDISLPVLVEAQAPNLPRATTVVIISTSNHNIVEPSLDGLMLRRLKPVVIMLDGASFGGGKNSKMLVAAIERRGVPIVSISYQMDIRDRLEHGFGVYRTPGSRY